jgi:heme/copper-type cytochrome/quinol oxidase subunit 2
MSSSTALIIVNILFGVSLLLILFGVIYARLKSSADEVSFSEENIRVEPVNSLHPYLLIRGSKKMNYQSTIQ